MVSHDTICSEMCNATILAPNMETICKTVNDTHEAGAFAEHD